MGEIAERFNELQGRLDIDLMTRHFFADGMVAKRMELPAGYVAGKHKHSYTHLAIIAEGSCIFSSDEKIASYKAGDCIVVPAGLNHEIRASEDLVWFCIHATTETDPEKLDKVLIEGGA